MRTVLEILSAFVVGVIVTVVGAYVQFDLSRTERVRAQFVEWHIFRGIEPVTAYILELGLHASLQSTEVPFELRSNLPHENLARLESLIGSRVCTEAIVFLLKKWNNQQTQFFEFEMQVQNYLTVMVDQLQIIERELLEKELDSIGEVFELRNRAVIKNARRKLKDGLSKLQQLFG